MADNGTLNKNSFGYGYKYTDLSEINKHIYENGGSYYQYTKTEENGSDYIYTVKIDKDGNRSEPIRGCKVVEGNTLQGKANPAQVLGSSLTYARRYSLLMAYGLATEDDDAEPLTEKKGSRKTSGRQNTANKQQNTSGARQAAANKQQSDTELQEIGQTKAIALKGTLEEKGIKVEFVCGLYNVESLSKLTEKKHANIIKHLDDIKKKQEEHRE